ncbi:hypothetical protein ACFFRR_003447 [Megaselia abdita]
MPREKLFPVTVKRNVNFQSEEDSTVYEHPAPEASSSKIDQRSTGAIRKQQKKPILKESNHKPESFNDLTPRSKAAAMPAITKALNFRPEEKVFGNLISLNVNDSFLPEKVPLRKKYVFTGTKDPEPELKDFLKPVTPLTHTIPIPKLELTVYDVEFNNFQKYKDFCKEAYGEEW